MSTPTNDKAGAGTAKAANSARHRAGLFDIRNIIGALMGIYGVILVGMSFTTSEAGDYVISCTGPFVVSDFSMTGAIIAIVGGSLCCLGVVLAGIGLLLRGRRDPGDAEEIDLDEWRD